MISSNTMIPKAHMSTYVVGSPPFTTSGAMYVLVVSFAKVSLKTSKLLAFLESPKSVI